MVPGRTSGRTLLEPLFPRVRCISVSWPVWQQWSALASVIVFCRRGCQLVTVGILLPSPQRFFGRVFTKPSKAKLLRGRGTGILGNVFLKLSGQNSNRHITVTWERVAARSNLSSRSQKETNLTSHLVCTRHKENY